MHTWEGKLGCILKKTSANKNCEQLSNPQIFHGHTDMGVGDLVVNSNTVRDLDITSITYALPLRYANQCVQIFS